MTAPTTEARTPRRGFVVMVLVAVLAAAALLERADSSTVVARVAPPDMPVASPVDALSSTWYCAGGAAAEGAAANASVVIANPGDGELRAVLTVVPSEGQRATRDVAVPAHAVRTVRLSEVLRANFAAVTVDIDGGGAVVEQTVTGALGESSSPCASAASDRWYFADGATRRESTLVLSLYNPFPENAIADMSFATDQGRAVPRALQGLVVPARSLVVRNIGDFVRRRETVATTVSVRTGRLVASKLQLHDGGGRKGMALVLGAPSVGEEWRFAEGYVQDGVTERLAIFNPGSTEARIDVEMSLEQGAAEPFELTVPARERVTLNVNEEARIPKGDPHAIAVFHRTGSRVVVERTIDAIPPSGRQGFIDGLGSRRTARRWGVAVGSATGTSDEWLVVHNAGARAIRVSITALAGQRLPVAGLQDVTIPAGRRQALRLGDHIERAELPLLVEATGPVVVERAIYRVGGIGMSSVIAIPLG